MNPRKRTNGIASVLFALSFACGALVVEGCVDQVDTALKSCPCATGNVCCASGVCAENESACGAATAALSASVQGQWEGYIENFKPEADDRIAVSISVGADGELSGTVKFGAGAAPPAATDPSIPWPPGRAQEDQTSYLTGIDYTARDITWLSRRLKLRIQTYEPWQNWCALQQPSTPEIGNYNCTPTRPNMQILYEADGIHCSWAPIPPPPGFVPTETFDCSYVSLCNEVCHCEASGCEAVPEAVYALDIAFRDHAADGSINIWNTNYNLRLNRTPRAK